MAKGGEKTCPIRKGRMQNHKSHRLTLRVMRYFWQIANSPQEELEPLVALEPGAALLLDVEVQEENLRK